MKNVLFLLVFCLTSTLFVSGQTFKPLKSSSGNVLWQKTSNTTVTLKFENSDGIVLTKYLTLSNRQKTAEENYEDKLQSAVGHVGGLEIPPSKIYTINGEDSYVLARVATMTSVKIFYYNALGREIWNVTLYFF